VKTVLGTKNQKGCFRVWLALSGLSTQQRFIETVLIARKRTIRSLFHTHLKQVNLLFFAHAVTKWICQAWGWEAILVVVGSGQGKYPPENPATPSMPLLPRWTNYKPILPRVCSATLGSIPPRQHQKPDGVLSLCCKRLVCVLSLCALSTACRSLSITPDGHPWPRVFLFVYIPSTPFQISKFERRHVHQICGRGRSGRSPSPCHPCCQCLLGPSRQRPSP